MKIEMVRITPDMASRMLSLNTKNRNLSDRLVSKYSQDMTNGNWSVTHQGIAFYEDGTLADGQHRLEAIIRSGATVTMYITQGLQKTQSINIDAHRPRSTIDGIRIGGLSDWIQSKHISMASVLTSPKRLAATELVNFLESISDSAQFATDAFPTNRRYLTASIIHAALCLAHFAGERPSYLRRFAEVLLSGIAEGTDERVIVLAREAFLRNPNNTDSDKIEKFLKLQRAISSYCHDIEVLRLTVPKETIYTMEGMF
jgi:hypothetical protein